MNRRGTGTTGALALVAGLAVCCGVHILSAAGGLAAVTALLPGPSWAVAVLALAALIAVAGIIRRLRRGASR